MDRKKPKKDPGRNGRDLAKERAWEAERRGPRPTRVISVRPTVEQWEWFLTQVRPGETHGAAGKRLLFEKMTKTS